MSSNSDDNDNAINSKLEKKLLEHLPANRRTTDEIKFVRSENDGGGEESSQRSASGQLTQQKHTDKKKVSSRSAFEQARNKTSTAGHMGQLPHLGPISPTKPKLSGGK